MTAALAGITVGAVEREELPRYLADLARLRVAVFRDYPYLYEGSLDYEQKYLTRYAEEGTALFIARDAKRIVGASTAMPLSLQDAEVILPLTRAGLDVTSSFYFGESVLLSAYRGRGIGHAFFDLREETARQAGFKRATFCAVERPDHHPQKPVGYQGHDVFWRKRGYARRPELVAHFSWRDLGDSEPSVKPMVFWTKELL